MSRDFTTQQVQDIAGLRIQIYNCEEQLKFINKIMEQLTNDEVDFDFNFQVHNKTKCEKNKARYRIKTMNQEAPFGVILPYSSNHNHCRSEYSARVTESQALRILVAFIAELQTKKENLQEKLESLLKINYTPIQHLYDENFKTDL